MALAEVCGLNSSSFKIGSFHQSHHGLDEAILRDADFSSQQFTMPYNYDVRQLFGLKNPNLKIATHYRLTHVGGA